MAVCPIEGFGYIPSEFKVLSLVLSNRHRGSSAGISQVYR